MNDPQCLRDIMTRSVITIRMDQSLAEAAAIFEEHGFHHVMVMEGSRLVGVVSDRDILKNVSPFIGSEFMERGQDLNTLRRKVHQVMTREPIVGRETMSISDAGRLMLKEGISCLPVLDDTSRLRGIVSWRDLLPLCIVDEDDDATASDDDATAEAA